MGFLNNIKSTLNFSKATSVKKLSTFLGTLFKEAGVDPTTLPYHGTSVDFSSNPAVNPRAIMGQYEAAITQAAYMSRLAYNSNMQKFPGVQLINENPLVFNTGLSLVRRELKGTFKSQENFQIKSQPYISDGTVIYDKKATHETPCYLQVVDYRGMTEKCPHPGKKILYIAFRGTLSLKSAFLTDANLTSRAVADLLATCSMGSMTGTGAFQKEVSETALPPNKMRLINQFGAHQGFILNLMGIMNSICQEVERIASDGTIDRIIITGHSLGAANATLASLVLGGFKRAGVPSLQRPTIHCISFGGPKMFLDYTRNVYNGLLDGGHITLDRVAARMENLAVGLASAGIALDLVPTIPPNFVHAGYMIRKFEIKTQSRTGRSKNITDLRQMFGGIEPTAKSIIGSYSEFNGLPAYKEFLDCFSSPFASVGDYDKMISYLPFGTVYPIVGKKQDTYDYAKGLVGAIFGKVVGDIGLEEAKKEAEQDKVATNVDDLAAAKEQNEGDPDEPSSVNQSGGGPLKDIYNAATALNGPNHIVYSCRKNVSPFSCHLGYMGISYNGLSIDSVGYSPPPLSFFRVNKTNSTMTYVIPKAANNSLNKTKNQPIGNVVANSNNPTSPPIGGRKTRRTSARKIRKTRRNKN
jgi:hypothetical protein